MTGAEGPPGAAPLVLHVLPRLTGGGPTRSLVALVKQLARRGSPTRHRALVLGGPAAPMARIEAARAGLPVTLTPDAARCRQELASADIVHLHYWNSPEILALLHGELPPMRLLNWLTILGAHAPQAVTAPLLDLADVTVTTTPLTNELDVARHARTTPVTIAAVDDPDRLADVTLQPHEGLNVGYVGTTSFTKMHPDFVAMCAAVRNPSATFVVCGEGGDDELRRQAHALGIAGRMDVRGYVEDIGAVLSTLDVFGYPLCADTYATTEKSLLEAMSLGIPPVVFPHGGVRTIVEHERTGLVVDDPAGYSAAIDHLLDHPAERRRLGANARRMIAERFQPARAAADFDELYDGLLASPKRSRSWPSRLDTDDRPAAAFADAVGQTAPWFADSLSAGPPAAWEAADALIASSQLAVVAGEGGIFHHRNHAPHSPHLRLWSALVLDAAGRHEAAARELAAAESGLGAHRLAHLRGIGSVDGVTGADTGSSRRG